MSPFAFPVQKNNQVAFGLVAGATLILFGMLVLRLLSGLKDGYKFKLTTLPFFMKESSGYHTGLYFLLFLLVAVALFMLCTPL